MTGTMGNSETAQIAQFTHTQRLSSEDRDPSTSKLMTAEWKRARQALIGLLAEYHGKRFALGRAIESYEAYFAAERAWMAAVTGIHHPQYFKMGNNGDTRW